MIRFEEACEAIGYDRNLERPTPKYAYYAYKAGSVEKFESRFDAEKFSTNVERVICNKDELEHFSQCRSDNEKAATEYWKNALREEYSHLSDRVFYICYQKAYEDGHSAGLDEVTHEMYECVEFAEKILSERD